MSNTVSVSAQRARFAYAARLAVLVGCGVAVAGCSSAIETVRSLRGINKNDPDPATAPFSGNMAAAEAATYPNLASVPPPPTRSTSAAERQKLTENLVAERTAAQAFASAAAAAPPTAAKEAVLAAASPQPSPAPASPATAPAQLPLAKEAPPAVSEPPAPAPIAAAAPPPTAAKEAAPAAAPEPPPATTRTAMAGKVPGPNGGNTDEPNQALPRDSDLVMPQVRSLPEPDAPRPAPAAPRLSPLPSFAAAALPPPAIASAAPQPPPLIPELAPIAPPRAPSLATTETPRVPAATTVAMLDALDPGRIAQVAARYKEDLGSQPPPRAVRVIAYTAPPAPGADPLGGYHDALDRAQGVAKALAEAGIPEKMIQTEARPAAGPIAAARIEIQFLP